MMEKHLKEDHDSDDDDDHDDFTKYIMKSLDWCFKSSDNPQEVVECFQELIPVCRFNEKCKKRMQDFVDKHHIKMDIETGNMYVRDASYMQKGILDSKQIKGKSLVEKYLDYIQEDQVLVEGTALQIAAKIAAYMGLAVSNVALRVTLSSMGVDPMTTRIVGLGAIVMGVMLIDYSFKAYQRALSEAARYCSDKSGVEKDECMKSFRLKAKRMRISKLQDGMKFCNESKDPAKCKAKVSSKISKLRLELKEESK